MMRIAELAREQYGDYGDEAAALIVFAAYTGVCPGGLAALRWDDTNPADCEATIRWRPRRPRRCQGAEDRTRANHRAAAAGGCRL
jgi:integrase